MSLMIDLHGKTGIVTGAARGIGAAAARKLCEGGADVVLTDVLTAEGTAVAQALRDEGWSASFVTLDVRDADGWARVVGEVSERFGRLNFLVNNAGIVISRSIEDATEEDFLALVDVNVLGAFRGMQAVIPAMKESNGGAIVNMASTATSKFIPATTIYGATKSALASLSKGAAVHLAQTGTRIRVNTIHPGPVDTEFMREGLRGFDDSVREGVVQSIPLNRVAEADDISGAICFLVSDESAYITGSELFVDGGFGAT